MTEDYKSKLIKYLTGNINSGSGTNEPQFIDNGVINQNVFSYLSNKLNTPNISGMISQQNYSYYLFYGYYSNDSDMQQGFIYITDKNLFPISLITEYDSGTIFRPFESLNVDENGYIYGVDNKNELYDESVPNKYRFIMLNKIIQGGSLTGNFSVKLRASYFFPNSVFQQNINFGLKGDERCQKKEGSADYFFIVLYNYGTSIISLSVNVGESNVWKITSNPSIFAYGNFSCLKKYNSSGDLSLLIGASKQSDNYDNYVEAIYNFNENPTFQTTVTIPAPNQSASFVSACKTSEELTYVAYQWVEGENTLLYIYKINYSTLQFEPLYTFIEKNNYLGSYIRMYNQNGLTFFKYGYYGEETDPLIYPWNSKLGMIFNDNVYLLDLEQSDMGSVGVINVLYINQEYNLITIYSPLEGSTSQKIQLIFNLVNYNGLPYEAPNCLVPNSGILYDNDNNIIFARNLYNKTVLGATTTSTLQIPNTMLNDTTIGLNKLISETNLPLTEDTTDITKNIYETVNINFANSISIRNDNDPNNTILNPTASVRLNGSTTQNNNYDDVKATKVRVNYTDGTNMVIALNPSTQINALTDTTYQYNFILQISKEVNNLQIISNDELTIYQTIDNLTLEVGKTYNILQGVEIQ